MLGPGGGAKFLLINFPDKKKGFRSLHTLRSALYEIRYFLTLSKIQIFKKKTFFPNISDLKNDTLFTRFEVLQARNNPLQQLFLKILKNAVWTIHTH